MHDIVTIGDAVQDIFLEMDKDNAHLHCVRHDDCQICFDFANKVPVKAKYDLIGGNAANTAVAFSRLGLNTAMYTELGDDPTGHRIKDELERNLVKVSYIRTDRHTESSYNTVINLNGERTILVYHPERTYQLPKMQASHWVYLTSMKGNFEHLIPDVIEYVREFKANLVYQPGTFQLHFGAKKSVRLLKHVKVFSVNREEAELYTGIEGATIRELLDAIRSLGPEIAVVTDGQKGAYTTDGYQYLHLDVLKDVPRIESTGAGDAFTAGFTAALVKGLDLTEALRWGQCEASSVIQHVGAQAGLLHTKQLHDLISTLDSLQAHPIP